MIKDRKSLKKYINEDAKYYKSITNSEKPRLFTDEVWHYLLALRHFEYHINTGRNIFGKIYWGAKYHHLKIRLGFDIPPNTCDYGLCIRHWGCIVINPKVKIGHDCIIQQGVNIGRGNSENDVPSIGNNVYIGPGAKIYGNIVIADDCAIGANAVVNKSFSNKGVVIAGVPATIKGIRSRTLE